MLTVLWFRPRQCFDNNWWWQFHYSVQENVMITNWWWQSNYLGQENTLTTDDDCFIIQAKKMLWQQLMMIVQWYGPEKCYKNWWWKCYNYQWWIYIKAKKMFWQQLIMQYNHKGQENVITTDDEMQLCWTRTRFYHWHWQHDCTCHLQWRCTLYNHNSCILFSRIFIKLLQKFGGNKWDWMVDQIVCGAQEQEYLLFGR